MKELDGEGANNPSPAVAKSALIKEPIATGKRPIVGCLGIIGAVLLLGLIASLLPPSEDGLKRSSRAFCQLEIGELLRDSGSAEFLDGHDFERSRVRGSKYIHLLRVRANNAFGGKVVSSFMCTAKKAGKGRYDWTLISLQRLH